MFDPNFFLMIVQVVIQGLLLGSIYSLVSMGLTLIWGTMKIINFSHGSLMMLSMYVTFWLWYFIKIDPLLSILIVFPFMYIVGYLVNRVIIMPIIDAERHSQLLMTFGLMLVIKNLALYFWTGTYRVLLTPYSMSTFWIGGIMFDVAKIISFIVAIGLSIGLHFFLSKTSTGMAIRAVAQDRDAASAMGIDARKIYGITCGLGIALAGVAGSLTTTYYSIFPDLGTNFMFMAFIIMVLGSMGNYLGALVAGLIIGVTESVSAFLFISSLRQAIAFILFVLILLFRPEGLFGKALRR